MEPSKEERVVIYEKDAYCTDIDGLFNLLREEDGSLTLRNETGDSTAHLYGISREDGSGFSFVVSLYVNNHSEVREIYVNDIDGRRKAENQRLHRSLYRM